MNVQPMPLIRFGQAWMGHWSLVVEGGVQIFPVRLCAA